MAELADFHPGTGHKHTCAKTRVSSGADCTEDCINDLFAVAQDTERVVNRLRSEQDNVDRNARAYGYDVAKSGGPPVAVLTLSADNPFIHPDWRERAGLT